MSTPGADIETPQVDGCGTKISHPRDTRDDTREHHRIALHVEEFLTYTFREVDRGNEKRRGAHTERVSATHTPRGAVGRGANRWDPKRGGGESRRRREMRPAQNGGGPKIGNPRGEDSAMWGPRIEGA